ncbi:MAG: isoleucine--tRNA ligase [Simkania sp.]|nr:isoleucine--tRNA ligase [Simkania sp.]
MFRFDQSETFPAREERILEVWQREKIFQRSVEQRKGRPLFSSFDGPPFATGLPHYGHLLTSTIKDVVFRFKTMQGFYVPRRFGWDCHGLPVENEIEKAKQLSGATAIEEFGIANFNEECRSIVLRYTKEWERTIHRIGRWVGFDDVYRTMDKDFMESVWWIFSQLFSKGLVYEGYKVMPFSAKLGTPLSNFEANLNYKEVDDPSLTVIFSLVDEPDTALLVWTTTPWTLPSNLAVMVGPEIDYVKVQEKKSAKKYILGKARLATYFKDPTEYTVLETLKGKQLHGRRYQPLFPYFAMRAEQKAFRVFLEDSISTEEGTGIVHSAPAFGEIDFFVCSREGVEIVCPVDQNGKFTEEVPEFQGQFVKDADKEIIRRLKTENKVFHHATIRHRYPFCWRSDTPLLYKVVRTWFVAVEKIKDKLLAANDQIHWVPSHIKEGRFGKWLENARDWAVSRNRYWGTPMPIWRSAGGDVRVFSSIGELEKATGSKIDDLHRHHIDQLVFEEDGKIFQRVPEVFDCWFESGSMPYAQNHFPFENKEETLKTLPADFIVEGLDQTRGWFYTLTVIAAALYDKPAFSHVIVNGIILAEDGAKMSKRLKNYPEPEMIINQYGADAVRLYLLQSNAVIADDMKFSERGVEQVMRQMLIPLWNSYVFFATYVSIYQWTPPVAKDFSPTADIDRWILSLTMQLQKKVEEGMDGYQLNQAVEPLTSFIEQLTNWYIRRSRGRFWSDEDTSDRREAFQTLYEVLCRLVKVAAPFIPFISEAIYQELRTAVMPSSVHLLDYPHIVPAWQDPALEEEMALVQTVISSAHALRKEHKLKVRQPLHSAHIVVLDTAIREALKRQQNLIIDELNVKGVVFHSDEKEFVQLKGKANFRILGKKVGPLMNQAKQLIEQFDRTRLEILEKGHSLEISLDGTPFVLTPEDVIVEREALPGLVAATSGAITIALDTTLNEALLLEGLARELVNKINTMRRDQGFAVTDRITITLKTTARLKAALTLHHDYVAHEVLAMGLSFNDHCQGDTWDLNGEATEIQIIKYDKGL